MQIPLGKQISRHEITLPIEVICGEQSGPRLFVCAAVHGDEIAGVEIVRRVLADERLSLLRGALIAVPIVNLHAFLDRSRYLPDRRDLNRSFPGSPTGSLASRLAHRFLSEVVDQSSHGIDLHTAALHRSNLPQIRAHLGEAETERLARAFGVPVVVNATPREKSLRQAGLERNVPILAYEGGEALRFDEESIQVGVRGVFQVMEALDMLSGSEPASPAPVFTARSSHWVRAPTSGLLRERAKLGQAVKTGDALGTIADPLGVDAIPVLARKDGVVIGRSELPLANEGDALFHIGVFDSPRSVAWEIHRGVLSL